MNASDRHLASRTLRTAIACLAVILLGACSFKGNNVSDDYGTLQDGQSAQLFTLKNGNGLTATLTDFGATLISLETPDRDGNFADITIGYDTFEGWYNDRSYMGATVGRYGNRIANGSFTLDGTPYILANNNGPHHLHGGEVGFNKKIWNAEPIEQPDATGVRFTYVSPADEEGYPGELTSVVTYLLNNDDELVIEFEATTNAPTVVNLVHHTYWNLTGNPRRTILDHKLLLVADGYVPTDDKGIPNAGIQPVEGTPMDFRSATEIGSRIGHNFEQLMNGRGYDHSWAINGEPGTLRTAASVYDPESGRIMLIKTDQPAIQFYTGNYMDGSAIGKGGIPHARRTGFCLETQVFPDSPNQPELSNAVLKPGETYKHKMVHVFRAR